MKLVFYQVAFNYAVLEDSWLTSSYGVQNRTYTTFNFDFYDTMLKTSGTQFQMIIMVDSNSLTTVRTNYNLIDVLSNTGGFASIITLVFSFLTKYIQKALYKLTIMRRFILYIDE